MKKLAWIILLVLAGINADAQSDIQSMLKQIAKLEIYIVDLEKGYQIAKEGLATIGEIKNGEFSLHTLFFSSLKTVNPIIMKSSKIADIASTQTAIVNQFQLLLRKLHESSYFTSAQISFILKVYTNLVAECDKGLAELIDVVSDGKLEMTDDERIKRIDGIYEDMKDRYAFTKNFTAKAVRLIREAENYLNEYKVLKAFE